MEIWQIAGVTVAVLILILLMMFLVVRKIIDRIFKRVDRPQFSSLVQFKDVKKEYPAELLRFRSGDHMLQGYLLGEENSKGLVVVVHGLGGGAEGYLNEILYFVKHGYQVFAYDNTGYHLSEGKNSVGLPQAVDDLDAALNFIEKEVRFFGLPVYLFGHSWGGYSVCAMLNFSHKVKAVVSVSGFNNPNKMMEEWAIRMAGKWAYVAMPFMHIQQRLIFGKKLDITAVDGINRADVPVLLAHGSKDPTVRIDGAATISCKEEITNPKVKYLLLEKEGQNGHLDVLYDVAAREYGFCISQQYSELLKKTKNKLTEEDKAEFFANVDKSKSSVSNEELMSQIVRFYEDTLVEKVTARIQQMEQYMDEVSEALKNSLPAIKENAELNKKIAVLTEYMDSGQWLSDYEADERGELPANVKRGVLSQDALYNLLREVKEISCQILV